jgi:hypothetical protein
MPDSRGDMMTELQYETEFVFEYWQKFKNIFTDGIIIGVINTMLALAATIYGPLKTFLPNFIFARARGNYLCLSPASIFASDYLSGYRLVL